MSPILRRRLFGLAFAVLLLSTLSAGVLIGYGWREERPTFSVVVFALFWACQWWQSKVLRDLRKAGAP